MNDKLIVVEQKEVEFYGDELTAVRSENGLIYVSVRHICNALGLVTHGQTIRIIKQSFLADGLKRIDIISTHHEKLQAYVLRVDLVPFWLSGLSGVRVKRVNEESRPKVVRFQKEATKVLWEAFDENEQRQERIKNQLGGGNKITPDQITAINQVVKSIAKELGKQTGKNEHGSVYAELFRRYRLRSRRELPATKYEDAIEWLDDWFKSLIDDEPF